MKKTSNSNFEIQRCGRGGTRPSNRCETHSFPHSGGPGATPAAKGQVIIRIAVKKALAMGVVCALLVGCDYTVPLVKTPEMDSDAAVIGLWQRSWDDGRLENLLVLPLSKQEVLVVFPYGSKNAMFARGCLWHDSDVKLMQLAWFGTAQAKLPQDNRTFQFASYAVEDDTLNVRLLNPEVVSKDIASSEALAQAIADNQDNPKLFRDPMVFKKVEN